MIKLNLLHLSNLRGDFQVCHLVLTIGRVCKYLIELHHCLFEGLNLKVLGLNHGEELVQLFDKIIYLSVEVREAGILGIKHSITRVLLSVELSMNVFDRLKVGKLAESLILGDF